MDNCPNDTSKRLPSPTQLSRCVCFIREPCLKIDVERFPQEIDTLLHMQGWQEKDDLSPTAFSASDIGRLIDTFEPPPEYWACRRLMESADGAEPPPSRRARFDAVRRKTGWARMVPWLAGWGLERAGRVLRSWAEN